jgi:DNA (cytosine-5)-methyltransferase 1
MVQTNRKAKETAREDLIKQARLALKPELIVDLFAGGGGMSTAMREAFGREPDIAINHNEHAISIHRVNHPKTQHFISDVREVDPVLATGGQPVGLLHASPDCTHFSQARAGQSRDTKIRSLSWVVLKWAGRVKPRVVTLENVSQILQWSPLVAKRDPKTGGVVKIDGTVAEPGERIPRQEQFLVPDKRWLGRNWRFFVRALRRMGYKVEWRKLKACDYGAPTSRERLFLVARRDGRPIVWPAPTHGEPRSLPVRRGKLKPHRTAAECINWSIPCPSIFTRRKPLADATMRRIAKGIKRYVIDAPEPFIAPYYGGGKDRAQNIGEPLRTQTACPTSSLVVPTLAPLTHQGTDRTCDIRQPIRTITGAHRGEYALITAFLEQAAGGPNSHPSRNRGADEPVSTISTTGSQQRLVIVHLTKFRGANKGDSLNAPMATITSGAGAKRPAGAAHALGLVTAHLETFRRHAGGAAADEPLRSITAGGQHHGLVECTLSPEPNEGALRVASFLLRYYSEGGQWGNLREPIDTITTRDRLALVTVTVHGTPYIIVDIGLRMLQPRELYLAQGFPADYTIEHGHDGRQFSKSIQVQMVGNSVSPCPAKALLVANFGQELRSEAAA